jgi:hypothetical protein
MSNDTFEQLSPDDVLLIEQSQELGLDARLVDKISLFSLSAQEFLTGWPHATLFKMSGGVVGSVLKANGGGWRKGKIRVRIAVEFCPDESLYAETSHHEESWPPPDAPS